MLGRKSNKMTAKFKHNPIGNLKKSLRKGIIAICILATIIGAIIVGKVVSEEKPKQFEWNDFVLSEKLIEPKSKYGIIYEDSEDRLSIDLRKTSKEEYKEYISSCENAGYTIESEKGDSRYNAYNSEGYELSLDYTEKKKEMSIVLKAPIEMGQISWPKSEVTKGLPKPPSNEGKIVKDSTDGFSAYIGGMPYNDYCEYVQQCINSGFNINYEKYEKTYTASNTNDLKLNLNYEGNGVIYIQIELQNEFTTETTSTSKTDETEKTEPESKETSPEDSKSDAQTLNYTTNNERTVKDGNKGVYSYKRAAGEYDIYYIIDFDGDCVYWFCEGNGDETCDKIETISGDLKTSLVITYHDGTDKWSETLSFGSDDRPDWLIMQDENGFAYDYYETNLDEALKLKNSKREIKR